MSDRNQKADSVGNYACIVLPWSSIHPGSVSGLRNKKKG